MANDFTYHEYAGELINMVNDHLRENYLPEMQSMYKVMQAPPFYAFAKDKDGDIVAIYMRSVVLDFICHHPTFYYMKTNSSSALKVYIENNFFGALVVENPSLFRNVIEIPDSPQLDPRIKFLQTYYVFVIVVPPVFGTDYYTLQDFIAYFVKFL